MLSRLPLSRRWRQDFCLPGAGVPIVFRQQMRSRAAWRDLVWAVLLVVCHQAMALALQSTIMPLSEYTRDSPRFLLRWLSMAALAAPLITLPCAAVIGAMAAPPASQFEATQSALLTRLTAFDICTGRLLAWIWPVLSALLASCAIALTVQVVWRPLLPGTSAGYGAILVMHLALLTAMLMIGSFAFLAALRRRPGRVWARGAAAGLCLSTLCVAGLLLINPLVRRMNDPTALINSMLLINPATAATTALHMDVLRLPWLYERTGAPEYPFSYPSPLASCAAFGGAAFLCLGLASIRLRRAYR